MSADATPGPSDPDRAATLYLDLLKRCLTRTAFPERWRRYEPQLGALMKAQLERIVATEGLSKNVLEKASRALAD